MAVRRKAATPAKATPPARRGRPRKAATAVAEKPKADVTVYADKAPTDYHKAFARWIVQEVGYDPNSASSMKAAFLAGVSIATASRPAFMDSDYLEEWREANGVAKRGPKGAAAPAKAAPAKRTRKAAPEPEAEEFEDDDELEDDEDDDLEDDEFDDEDDDEDEDEFDDEEEEEEEEPEPAPVKRGRGRPRKTAAAPAKAAPAKRTRAASKADDDEFLF